MSSAELPLREAIAKIVGSIPVDEYEAADRIIALFEQQFTDEYGDLQIPEGGSPADKITRLAFAAMARPWQMSAAAITARVLRFVAEQSNSLPTVTDEMVDRAMDAWNKAEPARTPFARELAGFRFRAALEAALGATVQAFYPFSDEFIKRFRAALHVRASNLFWKREKDEQIIREALQDSWNG